MLYNKFVIFNTILELHTKLSLLPCLQSNLHKPKTYLNSIDCRILTLWHNICLIKLGVSYHQRQNRIIKPYLAMNTFKNPDVGLTLNGALAGLVATTAPCANVSPLSAVIIGDLGNAVVVYSVLFFERIKVDDPVGAVSVHGVCGAWGTLAAGFFDEAGFSLSVVGVQFLGIAVAFIRAVGPGLIVFKLISVTIGLRVAPEEEMEGLDLSEHRAVRPHWHSAAS